MFYAQLIKKLPRSVMADLSSNEIEIAAESKVTNGGEVASVQKESPAKVLP